MFIRRIAIWKLAAGAIAMVVFAFLLVRPAAFGLAMMIFIMAGLPALYRLRRYKRNPSRIADRPLPTAGNVAVTPSAGAQCRAGVPSRDALHRP